MMRRHLLYLLTGFLFFVGSTACETRNQPAQTVNAQVGGGADDEEGRDEAREQPGPTKSEPAATTVEIRHKVVSETATEPVAQVGAVAPDFTLTAYHEGAFKQVTLSEYRGQWVLLCFYPGDFTFV